MDSQTRGNKGSGKYFKYLCYDDEIKDLAGNFGRQTIELLNHPAYNLEQCADQALKKITLSFFNNSHKASIISRISGDNARQAVNLGTKYFGFGSINDFKLKIHLRLDK